jgi:hypothetical protein
MTHVALAAVMVSGTALVGWWAVPALGLAYGVWRGSRATPLAASGAAAMGWGALMAFNWVVGPTSELSELLGSVLRVPAWVLPLVTLAFPALLAGTSAVVGSAVRSKFS